MTEGRYNYIRGFLTTSSFLKEEEGSLINSFVNNDGDQFMYLPDLDTVYAPNENVKP